MAKAADLLNMKNESNENNESLSKALREWKVDAPLPPRFQEDVWQQIARAEAQHRPGAWQWLAAWIEAAFRRPALAMSCALVLLAAGATVGWSQARQETARVSGELRVRYVHSVDPYKPSR